ncbi:hypothetical protein ENH_00044660 [Eimeria necatrix]|uniref:Uncharacterized protein n=1 Tax=Eimeria necatrix TaxID=51315 RepID=U6N1V0_9EIME|nr:hypothetical protein ENH_00044660 [Eimeria necatrix]CDJ67920.1 hypothetical protein ENH_00044660 [Eimeria necatrix]
MESLGRSYLQQRAKTQWFWNLFKSKNKDKEEKETAAAAAAAKEGAAANGAAAAAADGAAAALDAHGASGASGGAPQNAEETQGAPQDPEETQGAPQDPEETQGAPQEKETVPVTPSVLQAQLDLECEVAFPGGGRMAARALEGTVYCLLLESLNLQKMGTCLDVCLQAFNCPGKPRQGAQKHLLPLDRHELLKRWCSEPPS